MSNTVFNEDAGRFLGSRETKALKEAYRQAKLACGQKEKEFIRSEFLGLDKVKKLLDQPGCVGLRIAYGKRWEDKEGIPTKAGKGQLKPRVLLTAVDVNGNDLILPDGSNGRGSVSADLSGLKDDGDGDEQLVLGDGFTCPQHCPR